MSKYHFIKEYSVADYEAVSQQSLQAAQAMLQAQWTTHSQKAGVILQSTQVNGDFVPTHLKLMKAQKTLPFKAADIFAYLTSPEGFAILDPVSNPANHYQQPLFKSQAHGQQHYEITSTQMQLGLMKREFLVLNTYDQEQKLFVSTSVAAPTLAHNCQFPQHQRAYNSFVLAVVAQTSTSAIVTIINFMDLRLNFPLSDQILNFSNQRFLQHLFKMINHELLTQTLSG
ncbi:MAG: hypothetical protein ACRC17_11675 [Culicoidibacterales bacterium]